MSDIPGNRLENLKCYWTAANYLSVAQIYLKANALLQEPLKPEHVKKRLLGHFGTTPGLNFIYAHLNRLIQDTDASILNVTGPGHGAPSNNANLYLEGTLGDLYDEYQQSLSGINHLVKKFSWPGGLPSHNTALTPGALHEGGELGYALAHSFGAVFDNPDLLVACVVGDGEAETGPLAASWNSVKYLNPARDGAVLPILHLNGYKIGSATIFGRMSREEINHFFVGHGYDAHFVGFENLDRIHHEMWEVLDSAYDQISKIQSESRSGNLPGKPHWPAIILKTPKGWTGPEKVDGKQVEGTFRSHQIPVPSPSEDQDRLKQLEEWLQSYYPEELFNDKGMPLENVAALIPDTSHQMGRNKAANGGEILQDLQLPDFTNYELSINGPGEDQASGTRVLGEYLRDVFRENDAAQNFRLVCPDEIDSNKLSAVFEETERVFTWPLIETDENVSNSGRVMEILSEHMCQGWLEGYLLTGRHGLFACYEAFITIVDSMVNQYAKWIKVSKEVPWRKPVSSLNYLLTSHSWRQDHNGYSHQGPGFINTLLTKKRSVVRIYLPPDANTLLATADECLGSKDYVNLIISSKQQMPQWLNMEQAKAHCDKGASVWEWASNDKGDPDVILAAAGDVPTEEMLAAAWLLRKDAPDVRVRVVNVIDLLTLESHRDHPHGFDENAFAEMFTRDKPVVFAFHGYPNAIHELVHHRPNPERFHVKGYQEEGTTTTPFDMVVENGLSRFHLAMEALRRVTRISSKAGRLIDTYNERLVQHKDYIRKHGEDIPEIADWQWG